MDALRRILIAEDEPELREIICEILTSAHHQVVAVKDGKDALDQLQAGHFSLVLSDIQMPTMTGLELLTQANAAQVNVPFIFVTGFNDHTNLLNALRLGAFDFIKKPFVEAEVLSVVDRALEVGVRRKNILRVIQGIPEDRRQKIVADEKMIRLLQISNNKKRA